MTTGELQTGELFAKEMSMPRGEVPDGVFLLINSQLFPITKSSITIGRKLENDLVVHDPVVSREHAEIRYEGGKFIITDLGSTSGTLLNNKPIEKPAVLYSGDVILLASVPLMFVMDNPELSTSTESPTSNLD